MALVVGRAAAAAISQEKLFIAICMGLAAQKRESNGPNIADDVETVGISEYVLPRVVGRLPTCDRFRWNILLE